MNNRQAAESSEVRYELKLPCEAMFQPQVRSWIRLHPEGFRSAFATRQINNLYLDSLGLTDLAENLSGQAERTKLRLRWYGPHSAAAHCRSGARTKDKEGGCW